MAPAAGCDAPPLSSTPDGWERQPPAGAPCALVGALDGRETEPKGEPEAEALPTAGGPAPPGPPQAAGPGEAPGAVPRLLGLRRGEVRGATGAGIWGNHF